MKLAIDVQGFAADGDFIPKELAITDGTKTSHYIFKPPRPFRKLSSQTKKTVRWLERYHHGLRWNDGVVDLAEVPVILRRFAALAHTIYVKGHQKLNFLQQYINEDFLINLEHCKIPNVRKEVPACFYHSNNNCICALNNCVMIYNYVKYFK